MKIALLLISFISSSLLFASSNIVLDEVKIDHNDKKSLQRGAQVFMDNCKGCHSLKYMRYKDLSEGISLIDKQGDVLTEYVKENWMYSNDDINNYIITSLQKTDGVKWFGKVPPDLSLVSRSRGNDWVYTYMRSFYQDDNRPLGVNNKLFNDVAMPHVLDWMKTSSEYDVVIADLINFLSYIGEPIQLERKKIGLYFLIYLCVFAIFSFILYREYWKDIKK